MAWTSPRTWVAGETVTASLMNTHVRDNLKAVGDPWTAYTPVLTATTVNPTLGTGAVQSARYLSAGKLTIYQGVITFGTAGVAAGTGNYSISLPVAAFAASVASVIRVGTAVVVDTSAGSIARCDTFLSTSTTLLMQYQSAVPLGVAAFVASAAPMAWSTSDQIFWNVTYEAA